MLRIAVECSPNSITTPEVFIDNLIQEVYKKISDKLVVNKIENAMVWEIEGISYRKYKRSIKKIENYFNIYYGKGLIGRYAFDYVELERKCYDCGSVMMFKKGWFYCPRCSFRSFWFFNDR